MQALFLALVLQSPSPAIHEDTVFVRPSAGATHFQPLFGHVRSITSEYLILGVGDSLRMFRRESVGYVGLGDSLRNDYEKARATVSAYWNRDARINRALLMAIPVFGAPLAAALDGMPDWVGDLFSVLVVLIALSWFAYKLYDLLLVSREHARLSRLKLNLEIIKVRYEALQLAQSRTAEAAALAALEIPMLPPGTPAPVSAAEPPGTVEALAAVPAPGKRGLPNPVAALGRLIMSPATRARMRGTYLAELRRRFRESRGRAQTWYFFRRGGLTFLTAVGALYGSVGLLGPLLVDDAMVSSGSERIGLSVVYIVLGLIAIRLAWRWRVKGGLIREAYEEALKEHQETAPASPH